jgi:hypothetical protein
MRWAFALAVVAAAGCGGEPEGPSAFCLASDAAIAEALQRAPARAELEDGTPLSRCVSGLDTQSELQDFGILATTVAERLVERARAGDIDAALQLGFLAGAARRGAQPTGINAELVRRLERAATVPELGGEQDAALTEGVRAGEQRG